jgi:hypothetical protein
MPTASGAPTGTRGRGLFASIAAGGVRSVRVLDERLFISSVRIRSSTASIAMPFSCEIVRCAYVVLARYGSSENVYNTRNYLRRIRQQLV